MKGTVSKIWKNPGGWGFIDAEDGNSYYFHHSNVMNTATLKVGHIVEFNIGINPVKGGPCAENIRKIGLGTKHPFARDMQRIGEFIAEFVPDDNIDKPYILSDIDAIYKYFCEAEDYEQHKDVKQEYKHKEG